MSDDLKIKPVTASTWKDFEKLFSSKGAPGYCWCMAWRMNAEELKQNTSANRKKFIRKRVRAKTTIGILAYIEKEPVAWCSVAPRDTYRTLGGDEKIDKVWSLVCFFIKREFRDKGLNAELIEHAKTYAKKKGAKYLESYPVKPDSPSYRFMGFVDTFKKAGFSYVKKAGSRRNVMVCSL